MSTPILICTISKAALGDERACERLIQDMEYNLKAGHFTTFPCKCDPPCPVPTDEQLEALNEKVVAAIEARKQGFMPLANPTACCGVRSLLKCGKVYKCPCGGTIYEPTSGSR